MNIERDTIKVVDELFKTLQRIFPAFRQAWPTQEDFDGAKREWIKAFIQADMSNLNKIRQGIEKFRLLSNPFVPSPGQFIAMCKPNPEQLGIPSVEKAYDQACRNSHPAQIDKHWEHIVVKHAWEETGSYKLQTFSQKNSFSLFKRNYEASIQKFVAGESLGEIQKVIKSTSKEPEAAPSKFKKYEFSRPGVLKQYENIKTREEVLGAIEKLTWKGNLGVNF